MAEVLETPQETKSPVSLLSILKKAGKDVSTWRDPKTKLWSEPKFVAEDLPVSAFAFIQVSKNYENSVYAGIREGDEISFVSFADGELPIKDLVYDEKTHMVDIKASRLENEFFALGEVTALRDEDDFDKKIAKGDKDIKLYWI